MSAIEFRPLRLLLALTLASILASLPMLAVAFMGDDNVARRTRIASFCLGTAWLLWLAGTAVILAIAASQGRMRRADCHGLGALLAFLLPIAALVVIMRGLPVIAPGLTTPGPRKELPIDAAFAMGLFEIPFGLMAGWILWRFGFPTAAATDMETSAHRRSWRALHQQRIVPLLFLLPIPPVATAFVLLLFSPSARWPGESIVALVGWAVAISLTLTICGFVLLQMASRGTHGIGQAGCLALGGTLAFLIGGIGWMVGVAIGSVVAPIGEFVSEIFSARVPANLALITLFGMLLLPLGLPGGWLLWRFGVRPAPPILSESTAAKVFD